VTVHSTGFGWWQQLVDRYDWQMFRRVQTVSLRGPQYDSDLLPHLAQLRDLQSLYLDNTSIPDSDLAAWRRKHPRVAVTVSGSN
jgi:hypothetical protein